MSGVPCGIKKYYKGEQQLLLKPVDNLNIGQDRAIQKLCTKSFAESITTKNNVIWTMAYGYKDFANGS
ncbi:MAG: hypothetical protein ACUVRK_00240 [Spirochaetota bacterium]